MPQLDALRAFAVLGVLVAHYTPELQGPFWFGTWGVRLFFVLSGFLITAILLRGRRWVEDGAVQRGAFLRSFYARRALRLYPLLLAVLVCAAILNLPWVRATFWWHVTYLSNFLIVRHGRWLTPTGPLWSLAVEEQFYLVWPWLLLFLPRRALVPLVVTVILSAPVWRGAWVESANWADGAEILPLGCTDALGMGALLAIMVERSGIAAVARGRPRALALWVGLPLLMYTWGGTVAGTTPGILKWMFQDIAVALLAVWLVAGAVAGFRGPFGRLLETRALVSVGTISYGIYLNHQFLASAGAGAIGRLGWRPVDLLWGVGSPLLNQLTHLAALGAASVVLAALTWRFFERPINEQKRRFPYRASAAERRSVPRRVPIAR